MPEMFGLSGGLQQVQQSQDQHDLAQIQIQDTASTIAARGLGMQEESINIDKAKLALQNQKMFQQKLSQMHSGNQNAQGQDPLTSAGSMTTSLANDLNSMASLAMDSNMPEQAKDYAIAASTLQKNQAQMEKVSLETQGKNRELVEKLLPSVHDEASWKQANMIFQMETGHPSPYANHPYDPEFVKQIESATMTAKDKAITASNLARAKESEAKAREADFRTKTLLPSQSRLLDDRDKALIKNGGKALIPKAGEVKVITDLMQSQFDIDGTDTKQMADARTQARPIAERMNEILKENPGMKQTEAAKRAFKESSARGDFAGLNKNKALPGASPKSAMTLPPDKTKAKDGHWYTVKGTPMFLDGGKLYTKEELNENEKDVEASEDDEDEGDE